MERLELHFRAEAPGLRLPQASISPWMGLWLLVDLTVLAGLAAVLRAGLGTTRQTSLEGLMPMVMVLILWLSLWTGAGVLALRRWSPPISTHDRLRLSATTLEIRRSLAFLHRTRSLPREAIRTVRLGPGRDGHPGPLIAQLRSGDLVLTQLGSPQQRQQAAEHLQRTLAVPATTEAGAERGELPAGWECEQPSFDTSLLVPAGRLRRRALALLLVLPLAGGLLLLLLPQSRSWPWLGLLLIAGLAGCRAAGLALGRPEWLLGESRLTARRRFAGRVRPLYTIGRLELQERLSADGSLRYSLLASGLGRLSGRRAPRTAQVICSSPDDPGEPRALGRWLAARTRIPFHDLLDAEERRR